MISIKVCASNKNDNQIVEDKLKPDWVGDDILSKAVDAAISNVADAAKSNIRMRLAQ